MCVCVFEYECIVLCVDVCFYYLLAFNFYLGHFNYHKFFFFKFINYLNVLFYIIIFKKELKKNIQNFFPVLDGYSNGKC